MKKRRDILLKIFILILLFFYPLINGHANLDTQQYCLEISHDTDNSEYRLTDDNDSSDEDQIDRFHISDISEQSECKKYGLSTMSFLNTQFFSVWQPPKVF